MKIIQFKSSTKEVIEKAFQVLGTGGLVVYPSDTVYGLLVDAANEPAVKKLIEFKERPAGKPISVFCDFEMLIGLVYTDADQRKTIKTLLPGPFTIVLKSKHKVSKLLESEKGALGIRIPDYELINYLVATFQKPITATSANVTGRPPHYSIETFIKELSQKKKDLIDLIVDAGKLPRNKPSTVVDLTTPQIKLVRRGDIVFSETQTFLSKSPSQTKKLAQYIFKKALHVTSYTLDKPLIFILEGELGVGKTVFVKGIGEYLGIKNIVSPTFVVYYEYKAASHRIDTLLHVDLYNIQEEEEFEHLGLERYLKPGNILCFEWGEKAGKIFNTLRGKGKIIYIRMKYVNEKIREIRMNY